MRIATPAKRVLHKFYIKGNKAVPANFINEIADSANDAVGFIGHAALDDQGKAWGLLFAEANDSFGMFTSIVTSAGAIGMPDGPGLSTILPKLTTKVKIAFVGACSLSERFKTFWDIDDNTAGRVLITTPAQGTRLNVANNAWAKMIEALDDGCPVWEAIRHGNHLIKALTQTGQLAPHPTVPGLIESWEKTGDGNVRLRFVRKGICLKPPPE